MAPAFDAIPSGSTILVTGANGYIASHICDQLLTYGFTVRGTARTGEKGQKIKDVLSKRHDGAAARFDFVVVSDMAATDAFETAMAGCTGVVHSAADTSFSSDPVEVIPPQIDTMNSILTTASKTTSVKRFVLTASSNSLSRPGSTGIVTSESWNDEAVSRAWNLKSVPEAARGHIVYAANKTASERAAWDFVNTRKPGFVFNAVHPNFNIGLTLTPEEPRSTGGFVYTMFHNTESPVWNFMRGIPAQHMVDVQDVARLHVVALAEEDVKNERILAMAEPFNFNIILGIFRRLAPERKFPEENQNQAVEQRVVVNERSKELLRRLGRSGFTDIETCLKNCVYS